jgi:hypothetical protein
VRVHRHYGVIFETSAMLCRAVVRVAFTNRISYILEQSILYETSGAGGCPSGYQFNSEELYKDFGIGFFE